MSFPLSALPRCVVLRSKDDNSYLRSVHDESHGGSLIELHGGDGGIMNPRARFYLELSKEHEGLMHVRCCYNNKYWVPQQRVLHGGSARWIVGTADEPEEDLSKPSCTLHKLISISGEQSEADDGSTCRFLHSKLGQYACTMSSVSVRSYMHIASDKDEADRQDDGGLIDAFTVIDVSDQKQLPSYLVFKGDNGLLLQAVFSNKHNWLQFQSEDNDIGDPKVLHTVFTNSYGHVRIKSNYFDKFWKLSPYWIWPESTDTTYSNLDTIFKVTTGDGFIALRNMSCNRFCKRLTRDGFTNCLNASLESITNEARLNCYEPVISRDIYDVNFRLNEARMYTTGIDGLYSQTIKNRTSTINKSTLTFTYTNTVASTWTSTVSMKISLNISLVTKVPFFADGKIEVTTEFSGSYTWGETETKQEQVSKQLTVDVPPMKKVTVKAIGSNGVCDIPYSYKQKDVLINGQEVIQELTDGMYVGIKTTNITFDVLEGDLSDDED